MFKQLKDIVDIFDDNDPSMPGGKAIDDPTGDSCAGTSWDGVWYNQILGFFLAAIIEAFGNMNSVSGTHDRAGQSDVLDALKKIMLSMIDIEVKPFLHQGIGFFVKPVSGPETIIPLLELSIQYDPQKHYPVFVSPAGDYPEFISFNTALLADGLHVRPLRLIDGKFISGTRLEKWGTRKWGMGSHSVSGKKWGDGKWGMGKWAASRKISGDTWGAYASMLINVMVKEL